MVHSLKRNSSPQLFALQAHETAQRNFEIFQQLSHIFNRNFSHNLNEFHKSMNVESMQIDDDAHLLSQILSRRTNDQRILPFVAIKTSQRAFCVTILIFAADELFERFTFWLFCNFSHSIRFATQKVCTEIESQ